MTLLILGLALFVAVHLLPRVAPAARQRLTDRFGAGSKGIVALAIIASVVLMVIGYRSADFIPVYTPFPGAGHLNNLLMVIAFLMFGVGSKGAWLSKRMRHPMLTATKIWAVAHLLVNGDVASLILFGGVLAWAVAEVIAINRTTGPWTKTPAGFERRDAVLAVVWLAFVGVAAAIHIWLNHNPFLGTYG